MKNLLLKTLCGLSLLTTATAALAYNDTGFIAIGRVEASSGTAGSLRVYTASGFALPAICAENQWAEAQTAGVTTTERDLMNRQLMSAFMASRLVNLRLDGCDPANGRPMYRIVSVRLDH
jgi:hypothetical protein